MIVHNGAAFIEEALQSVYDQTRAADEIVVWDDGSTDETRAILDAHDSRIRSIGSDENRGALLARRAVVEAASHPYVAFLDADDRFTPNALASFEEAAKSSPSTDLFFGMMQNFYDLQAASGRAPGVDRWFHARTNGNMLAKKGAFLQASKEAKSVERSEFIAWYHSAQDLGLREQQIEAPIFERRIHEANASRHPETRREMMKMLKAKLDQKRRQQP